MKIIHITASYKPAFVYGGPIMSVAKLCEALLIEKTDLEVLTTVANGKSELPVSINTKTKIDGVSVTYFKRLTKDHTHFSPSLLKHLRQEILQPTQHNNLIIHIHAWWNLVSILSCFVAKWYKVPVVLSPRGMLTAYTLGNRNSISKKIIHNFLGKRLLKYCHVHATSNAEKMELLQYVSPKSVTVIANLVDLPHQGIAIKNTPNATFRIVFLSRVEEKKGLELLFQSLAQVNFSFNLSIAGNGEVNYISQLKVLATVLNIADKIIWLGHIPNNEKFKLIAAQDLLVLTSYNENFANVIVESLHVGTPVLISKNVGLADYVEKNNLGWTSDLEVKSIAYTLNSAYKDEVKRDSIRTHAPKQISVDFDSVRLADQYLELYKSVLQNKV